MDRTPPRKVDKPDSEWKQVLSPTEYAVARKKGTEPAFTGAYWDCHTPGVYACVCCGEELFTSEAKFDSGCGWPSFTAPADPAKVEEHSDATHGMQRTEVVCHACGAHLGHVFPDGPPPMGQRYCINSASLKLNKR